MGRYMNPPEKVKTLGRPLVPSDNFGELKRQLKEGEVLFGLYDGSFLIAPLIGGQEELAEFDATWKRRSGKLREFFAVAKTHESPKTGWNV